MIKVVLFQPPDIRVRMSADKRKVHVDRGSQIAKSDEMRDTEDIRRAKGRKAPGGRVTRSCHAV